MRLDKKGKLYIYKKSNLNIKRKIEMYIRKLININVMLVHCYWIISILDKVDFWTGNNMWAK